MATQLAERRADPVLVVRQNLTKMEPEFKAALPSHIPVEKFTRVAMTAINNNQDLLNADRKSLFGAFVRLAQDGLLPDGREAAIVMFGNKAQAMPMIAGVLKKIRQSGDVAKVSAQVVYEKDEFVWKLGFDEDVIHNPPPLDRPRGKPIGAYATAVLKDGSRLLEVMNLDEIEQVRKVSRASKNGPWVAWWGEMARKTVMRRLSKRLPMSTDLEDALDRDETLPRDEPPVIDQPVSRLDALEHHIDAVAEETPDTSAAAEGSGEVESPQDGEAAGAVQKDDGKTLFEKMSDIAKGNDHEEGPADEQRGGAVSLADAKDQIAKQTNVDEINRLTRALEQGFDDAEQIELRGFAAEHCEKLLNEKAQ